jgi:hypothetical protein
MKIFYQGEYIVIGLYWEVDKIQENDKIWRRVISKDTFAKKLIITQLTLSLDELILGCLKELNPLFFDYMKNKEIKRFFPFKMPSCEIKDDVIEICYYQDRSIYDIVFSEFDRGLVLEPNPNIMSTLEKYYESYQIDPLDENIYNY